MGVCAVIALGICLAAPAASAHDELPPDLAALPADALEVRYDGATRSELRLTTTIANLGAGPLEIYPVGGVDCNENGDPADDRLGYQRVFEDTAEDGVFDRAADTGSASYPAGCMTYHSPHDHWHFEDFSRFQLRTPAGDVVAANEKVSFCVADSSQFLPGLPGSPNTRHYTACQPDSTEGISVGWVDIYQSFLPGQFLPIGGIGDGKYCVAVAADPSDRLRESNDTNNEALRGISLSGSTVADSPAGCTSAPPRGADAIYGGPLSSTTRSARARCRGLRGGKRKACICRHKKSKKAGRRCRKKLRGGRL